MMTAATTPFANERAAAFAVAALVHRARIKEVSTQEPPDMDEWWPWAVAEASKHSPAGNWMPIAILAAEVIAMRPEKSGHGPRWNAAELEGLQIAARLTRFEPDKSDALRWIWRSLCGEWWAMPKGEGRRDCKERAEAEFEGLWQEALRLVLRHRPQIDALADMLRGVGYLDCSAVRQWWEAQ